MTNNLYTCPCCGYKTFSEMPDSYEICQVCFWEDDISSLENMYTPSGANQVSLEEAQKNFENFNACEECFQDKVKKINTSLFSKDPLWRKLDRKIDFTRNINLNSKNLEDIYYWLWKDKTFQHEKVLTKYEYLNKKIKEYLNES